MALESGEVRCLLEPCLLQDSISTGGSTEALGGWFRLVAVWGTSRRVGRQMTGWLCDGEVKSPTDRWSVQKQQHLTLESGEVASEQLPDVPETDRSPPAEGPSSPCAIQTSE